MPVAVDDDERVTDSIHVGSFAMTFNSPNRAKRHFCAGIETYSAAILRLDLIGA